MDNQLKQKRRTLRVGLMMMLLILAVAGLRGPLGPTPAAADVAKDQPSCERLLLTSHWTQDEATVVCQQLIAYQPQSTAKNLNDIVQWALQNSVTIDDWHKLVLAARKQFPLKDCSTTNRSPFNALADRNLQDQTCPITTASSSASGTCNWAGTWKGTDGDQTLTESFDSRTGIGTVTGRWSGWTSSTATNDSFRGTARGDGTHLDGGTWFNGNHGGTIVYTMASNCNSFSGQRYECYMGPGTGSQTGQGSQDPPHLCSSGNFAPMQISYTRSSGSPFLSTGSPGPATSSGGPTSTGPTSTGSTSSGSTSSGSSSSNTGGATTGSSASTGSGGDSNCFDLFGFQVCISP
jgi:hypothetical protein